MSDGQGEAATRKRRARANSAEGTGRESKRLKRTKEQTEECQARAYMLKTSGGMSFGEIASSPDPTYTAPSLYANASAARQAYLSYAAKVRGTEKEHPLSITERRALMDDRYERLIQAFMPRALGGQVESADRVLRAMRQQAELHGVNRRPSAPEVEDTGPEDPADELAERRARQRAEARERALRSTAPDTPPAAP